MKCVWLLIPSSMSNKPVKMPKLLKGVLIPDNLQQWPAMVHVQSLKHASAPKNIQMILQCQEPAVRSNCDAGVLFSGPATLKKNCVATQLRTMNSNRKMPTDISTISGYCLVLGEDEKGQLTHVSDATKEMVFTLWQELSGRAIPGLKNKTGTGPKRAKRALEFFKRPFNLSRKQELANQNLKINFVETNKEAANAWNNMSAEEKAPYVAMESQDKERYRKEKAEYDKKHPAAPKKPKSAYNIYAHESVKSENLPKWNQLTDEQKQPYNEKAAADKLRYDTELEVFKRHCQESGRDYTELVNSKRKASVKPKKDDSSSSSSSSEAKPKKKAVKSGESKPKKKAAKRSKVAAVEEDAEMDD